MKTEPNIYYGTCDCYLLDLALKSANSNSIINRGLVYLELGSAEEVVNFLKQVHKENIKKATGNLKNVSTGRQEYFSSYFPDKYIVKYIKPDKYVYITILEKTKFDNKELQKYLLLI